MDSEYADGEVERCCGVGALQASRDEWDADGRIGNGSARGRSEAKRNTNRKKQRKKAHHPVNGRKKVAVPCDCGGIVAILSQAVKGSFWGIVFFL